MNQITIVTAQNVTLKVELANIGDRFLAAIIDVLIKIGLTVLATVLGLSFSVGGVNWILGLFLLLCWVFYSLIFETFMNGQTPGKKLIKVRVARLDGEQVTFGSLFLRWLFRIIDFPVTMPAIGIFTIVFTEKFQRIGDLIAGTIIVSTKTRTNLEDTFYTIAEPGYSPVFPQAERLTGAEAEALDKALTLYQEQDKYELIQLAAKQLRAFLDTTTTMDDLNFVRTVLKDFNYSGSVKNDFVTSAADFQFSAS